MIGPCMCGDPYCPSCGDPGAAEMEAAFEEFMDKLEAVKIESREELDLMFNVGWCAVLNARELAQHHVAEAIAVEREAQYWANEVKEVLS